MRSGQKVGKYILGERIARGGMAEVWAAQVEGPEGFIKPVALKFVVDTGDPDLDRLFVNEARVAAQLQHPNLVTVFDFDRIVDATDFGSPGRYYIAMERVEGHDLRRVLEAARASQRRLPTALALYVAAEVLQALRYVHERAAPGGGRGSPLVHRDVSPHNVLLAYTGDVKLSDFGIAKSVAPLGSVTGPGLVRGKVSYAAPEQLRGRAVDPRADQFSLGVTLWEMLSGARLFAGGSDVEIARRVLGGEIPPLPRAGDVEPRVEAVVRRMLASEPAARFATTSAALAAVMALPGYSGDGAALGTWMGTLFSPRDPGMPTTQELPSPGRGVSPSGAGETRRVRDGSTLPMAAENPTAGPRPRNTPPTPRASGAPRTRTRTRASSPRLTPARAQGVARAKAALPAWAKWSLTAMSVAIAAWGTVMVIQVHHSAPGVAFARRPPLRRPATELDGTRGAPRVPIVAEPVRSGEPALDLAPPSGGAGSAPPGEVSPAQGREVTLPQGSPPLEAPAPSYFPSPLSQPTLPLREAGPSTPSSTAPPSSPPLNPNGAPIID